MKIYKIGIIGCGGIAQKMAATLEKMKGVERYAVASRNQEKAEAFATATRTELYFVSGTQHVVKYNTKSYTHVFANSWMYFTIGYSNKNGIFFNGINQNNVGNGVAWLNAISSTFNQSGHTSLVSGEVYSCARFGNDWRGMKIVKKP